MYRASGSFPTAEVLSQSSIDVYYVDSEETTAADNDADYVLDGDSATIWQTQWASNNVVGNGAFETNTTGWSFYTNGAGSLSTVSPGQGGSAKGAKVTLTTVGTNMQFWQSNLVLQPDTDYTLTFHGYCSTGRNVSVRVTKASPDVTFYNSVVDLGTGWSSHEINFTTTGITAPITNGRLTFWFVDQAQNGDVYYFDNVVLAAVGSTDNLQPHEIQLDLSESRSVSGIKYLPRQDASENGTISDYEIYVSDDPESWGTAVSTGTWANDKTEKTVTFTAATGQYVRLRSTSEVNGNPWSSAAELNVLVEIATTTEATATVHAVDSEETTAADNDADNVVDGDTATIWQTQWYIDSVITNGAFETNTAGWSWYSNGTGSLSTVSPGQGGSAKGAKVTLTTVGTNMQFWQSNLVLQPDTDYTLTFHGYCSTGRNVSVRVTKADPDVTFYNSVVDLGTGWSSHEINFTTTGITAPITNGRLTFWFVGQAQNGDVYYFDNVVLAPTSSGADDQPHYIDLDLATSQYVVGLNYLPRQDTPTDGTISDYEIYVSDNPESWGTAVSTGTWANDKTEKTVTFAATLGRYVRLRSTSEVNDNPWSSAAEIIVLVGTNIDPVFSFGEENAVAVAAYDATSLEYTHTEPTGPYCFVVTAFGYNTVSKAIVESEASNEVCDALTNSETYEFEWDPYTWATNIATHVVAEIDTPAEDSEIDLTLSNSIVIEGSKYAGLAPYTDTWTFETGLFADYNAGTTYNIGDTVTSSTHTWRALQNGFSGQTPAENSYWTQIDDIEDPCPAASPCKVAATGDYSIAYNVTDSAENTDTTPQMRYVVIRTIPDNPISKSDWAVCYVDSEETQQEDRQAAYLIDGDINTVWHTALDQTRIVPHEIVIDLDASDDTSDYAITKIKYTPRQDPADEGNPQGWELYALADDACGNDGDCEDCVWGPAVSTGTWANDKLIKEVNIAGGATARYLRFVVTSSYGDTADTWASGAEIDAFGTLTASVPNLVRLDVTDAYGTPVNTNIPVTLSHGDYLYIAAVFSEPVDATNNPTMTANLTSESVTLTPADPQPDGHGNGTKKILFKSTVSISRAQAHETTRLAVTAITGTYTASDDGVTTTATTPPALPTATNVQHLYQVAVDKTVYKSVFSYGDTLADALADLGQFYTTDLFYLYDDLAETVEIDLSDHDGTAGDEYDFYFFGSTWTVPSGATFGDYWRFRVGVIDGVFQMGNYGWAYSMDFLDSVTFGDNCTMEYGELSGGGSTGSDCAFDSVRH